MVTFHKNRVFSVIKILTKLKTIPKAYNKNLEKGKFVKFVVVLIYRHLFLRFIH